MTVKVAMTAVEKAARKAELETQLAQLNEDPASGDEPVAEDVPVDPEEQPDDETPVDEVKDDTEAKKIAASAQAKTHPGLAMAAISSGQTLEQFKANVEAQASAPKKSALAQFMENAPRLGADAPSAGGSTLGKALVADARKRAGKTE